MALSSGVAFGVEAESRELVAAEGEEEAEPQPELLELAALPEFAELEEFAELAEFAEFMFDCEFLVRRAGRSALAEATGSGVARGVLSARTWPSY